MDEEKCGIRKGLLLFNTTYFNIRRRFPLSVDFFSHPAFVNMTLRARSRAARFSLQTALPLFRKPDDFFLRLFIFAMKLVAMSTQSIKKADRPRTVTTFKLRLTI
jgi:hypothetical protein